MKQYLLAIDLGTSSCKAAVFDREGHVIDSASSAYSVYYPHTGWAEQDPEEWWAGICRALQQIWSNGKAAPQEIACVGVDGQSWSAVAIDQDGKCLTRNPIWMDTRAREQCEKANREIGKDVIFNCAGNPLLPSYSTGKVLWYRDVLPEVFSRTDKILQSNSYIVFCLTGEISQDLSQGYGWHCFNMRKGVWDEEMVRAFGLDPSILPPIMSCDHVAGKVTAAAANQCGLLEGTPVVAGGLDAAAGSLGAGVLQAGETQEQGGQAGGMSICLDTYKSDPRLILSFHVVPDRWLIQGGTVGGGGVMRWFEAQFADYERSVAKESGKPSLVQLGELAEQISPGADGLTFLPYMSGERTPIWDPDAKGVFYGVDFSKTKGHFVRACMEGVAYSLRHNLEVAEEAGASVDVLRAVGGSANSLLWTQIKSDVTGKPIAVPYSDAATTLGAAILAGIGCGMYSSYEEAVSLTIRETRRHEPDPEPKEAYDRAYRTYRAVYENLKNQMHGA